MTFHINFVLFENQIKNFLELMMGLQKKLEKKE